MVKSKGVKISQKWRRMQPIYQLFSSEGLDFTEEAALEMYLFESKGIGNLRLGLFNQRKQNGYAVGKHWMDVTVKMWQKDIAVGLLFIHEIYNEYPLEHHWWLNKIFKNVKIIGNLGKIKRSKDE